MCRARILTDHAWAGKAETGEERRFRPEMKNPGEPGLRMRQKAGG
jgi:hypothetical protein